MTHYLSFEKTIAEVEGKIEELRHLANNGQINIAEEVARLQSKLDRLLSQTYINLTAWQKVQVARHQDRPQALDYIQTLFEPFVPLSGDRLFKEDAAIVGGLARFRGHSVIVMGHQKGRDMESRLKHNFGMPNPEGYRKAKRLMELADRFRLPVITFVDTSGAYPGIDAEDRGQSEAIARCIATCLKIRVPFICVVIGEGGSGGAIAIAAANTVLMLEHSVYSVIAPESCATILWRTSAQAEQAANALRLTAQDLQNLGVIDGIITEPLGGAHRNPKQAIQSTGNALAKALATLTSHEPGKLLEMRREKFLGMGTKSL